MGNSPLVTYTKLSPNCHKPRNHVIDTLTIHCVVGHCTVKTIGDIFAPTSRGASSNYGVDDWDGIGLYVNESDRSWCTSSSANDNRAITIEVASDLAEPYAITAKAYATLVKLCVDICKRNPGIGKLTWREDKNKPGNMTVHRWFATKSCPGNYIYGLLAKLAAEVNAALGGTIVTPAPAEPEVQNVANDQKIYTFFIDKGLSHEATAGVVGNLYAESGLRPNNLQNSYEKSLGHTDESYTLAVDNGSYTNFVNDKAGYGLPQWTYYTRKQAFLDYVRSKGASIGDRATQLEFLWNEMQGYKAMMTILKNAKTVREASDAFLLEFEKPADQSEAVRIKRAEYGQGYYNKFKGVAPLAPATPNAPGAIVNYTVKVNSDALNIRQYATTSSPTVGKITDRGIYTIVEEAQGVGAAMWGKLKSGVGYISLDYCIKQTNTPTAPTPAPVAATFKKGDKVKIKTGAKYYTGAAVPSWVASDTWIVENDQVGDKVVINKNISGKNAIMSPFKASDLTLA